MGNSKKNRSPSRTLSRLFLQSDLPTYVVDPRGTIAFANAALGQWLQTPVDELIGLSCISPMPPDRHSHFRQASVLSIPSEIWMSAETSSATEPYWIRRIAVDGSQDTSSTQAVTTANGTWSCMIIRMIAQSRRWLLCLMIPSTPFESSLQSATGSTFPIHEQLVQLRLRYAHLDGLMGVAGTSLEANRCMAQIQAAIHCDQPVCVRGNPGSGLRQVAEAIFAGRRKRQGLSEMQSQLFPVECRLMDSALIDNFFELIESNSSRGTVSPQQHVLFVGIDDAPEETHRQIADFIRRSPTRSMIATASLTEPLKNRYSGAAWREVVGMIDVVAVDVPPIAARPDDLPVMAESIMHWLRKKSPTKEPKVISEESMNLLKAYAWPGNSDELVFAIESALDTAGTTIEPSDLPIAIRTYSSYVDARQREEAPWNLDRIMEDVEKTLMDHALKRFGGNRASAARFLGISRARLLRRLEQWNLEPGSGRQSQKVDEKIENDHIDQGAEATDEAIVFTEIESNETAKDEES